MVIIRDKKGFPLLRSTDFHFLDNFTDRVGIVGEAFLCRQPEMGIYKRKQELNQESDQENNKKRKKTRTRSRKPPRKKEKTFCFS